MPGLDYSRFDAIDASDSDGDEAANSKKEVESSTNKDLLTELPSELSPGLSLVLAARNGQTNIVEALLDAGAPVDFPDPHGGTALLRAVEGGITNRPVIELLLKRRASPTASMESDSHATPLARAAANGPAELCEALLTTSTKISDDARGGALMAAASAGNRSTSRLLLAAGSPVTANASDGRTPLHAWAQAGDDAMLSELIAASGDVNAQDDNRCTALMTAVRGGHTSSIRLLCDSRAAVDVISRYGHSALALAAEAAPEASSTGVVRALLDNGAPLEAGECDSSSCAASSRTTSPLVASACTGRLQVVALLLEARAFVDAADGTGRRALPCAAAGGSLSLCKLLLDGRANVNVYGTSGAKYVEGGSGVTAVSIAAAGGNTDLVRLLLGASADMETLDERGRTPLMAAAV